MNNLQAEIYSIVKQVKRGYEPSLSPTEASKQLLQLFDKSVERVIGEDEEIDNITDVHGTFPTHKGQYQKTRNSLKAKQRQTWNKIKGGGV